MIKLKLKPQYIEVLTAWIGRIKLKTSFGSYSEMCLTACIAELEIKLKKWLCTPRQNRVYTISISYSQSLALLDLCSSWSIPAGSFIYVAVHEATAQIQEIIFVKSNFTLKPKQ